MARMPVGQQALGAAQVRADLYSAVVELHELPGAGDDGLDRPTVTPVPAPPDDQLIRLAKVGTIVGGIATLLLARWLRKHLIIGWRR